MGDLEGPDLRAVRHRGMRVRAHLLWRCIMGTLGRIAGGFALVGLLTVGGSAATRSGRAEQREPRILVEARMVQISDALSKKLGTVGVPAAAKNVTMPLAALLY